MFNRSPTMIAAVIAQDMREAAKMSENPSKLIELSNLYTRHFNVVRADTPALLDQVYELRYQVYCVENAFEDPAENLGGREMDADDDRAAHVLLIHRESGQPAGTARVIFPSRSCHNPLPIERILDSGNCSPFCRFPPQTTGEVSRFAVPKVFRRRRGE